MSVSQSAQRRFCIATLGILLPATAALAATAQLPTVVVTSEKSEQVIEQVPASVSSMSANKIKEIGAMDFEQLQGYIPNATISLSPDSGQFSIRGFATPDSNPGFDPSVGTVIDGVFYGRPQFLSAFFYDMEDFQVLRGPQGTLFGKNASAGLFELHSAMPRNQFMLRSEYLMNSDGDRSFRPVVQLPVGDKLSVRVSGNIEHGDRGVLYNTFLKRHERNANQDSGRVRARYTPTDALTIDIEAFVSTMRRHNNLFKLTKVTPRMAALFRSYDPDIQFGLDNDTNSANTPSENVVDTRGVVSNITYDFLPSWEKTGLSLTSTTAFAQARTDQRDIDADFSPVPFVENTLTRPSPYRQLSQELRLNGHAPTLFGLGDRVSYVSGLYYSRSAFQMTNAFHIQDLGATLNYILAGNPDISNGQLPLGLGGVLGGALGGLTNIRPIQDLINGVGGVIGERDPTAISGLTQTDETYATYAQTEWFFVPHWAVIAGLRLSLEHKYGRAFSHTDSLIIPQISSQRNFDQRVSNLEREFSPKFGFQWAPNTHSSVYLTFTRGFKSGGFNAIALSDDHLSFGPERADNYELGAKTLTTVFGRPLRAHADVFWTRFKSLQVSTLLNSDFVTLNAASARSRGFETDLEWLPFNRASLRLSAGYADAQYTSYPNAPATVAQTAATGQQTQDLGGRPLAFAPKWMLALTPGYTVPLPYRVAAGAFFDVLYQSGRYLDVDDDRENKYQGGLATFNARVMFSDPSGLWSLALIAHNLTDRAITDQIVNEPEAPGNYAAVRKDRGRYYTANLTFTFK